MPRKPDLPCAGCGKLMWRGSTSLPAGRARCRSCRSGGTGTFVAPDGSARSHGISGYRAGCRCEVCRSATSKRMATWHEAYRVKHGEAYSTSWRRRFAVEHGYWPQTGGADYVNSATRLSIYERDGWTCQLCEGRVDPDAEVFADRASLDHIVPRSRGGSDESSNLRLAHVGCNARRGDRVDVLEEVA